MLPQDQIENIKKQLITQLESTNLPNAKEIKESIQHMNAEQLEQFLIENNLIKSAQEQSISQPNQDNENTSSQNCVFCSIVSGKIPTYQIDENKDSIAVLEINPISKGHSIIIPKEHILSSEKIPQTSFSLAKKIAKKIKTKFKPREVLISSSNLFGHEIINILPIYSDETLASQRNKISPEELEKLKHILEKKIKPKKIKKPKTKKINEKIILPKRIP